MTRLPLIIVLLVIAANVAAADHVVAPSARRHVEAALAAYDRADYGTALREFEAAYAIDPDPALLYSMAQTHRLDGHCDRAVRLYKLFLASEPKASQRAAALAGMKRCADEEAKVVEAPAPPIAAPSTNSDPGDADDDDDDRSELHASFVIRPWWNDPVAHVLVGSGVVAIGVGTGFLIASRRSARNAEVATDKSTFEAELATSSQRRWIGIGAVSLGGALVVGAIVKYAIYDDKPRRVSVSISPTAGGVSLSFTGAFQ